MIGSNIGIDLGTVSVVVYVEGKGIVLNEPSAVAYDENGKIIGIGGKAYRMLEKNHDKIRVVKPLVNGVISDFTATKHMVKYFISKVCKNTVFKPNVIACVPSGVTGLEKRTILDLITASGAGRACLIEEPLAAALGSGIQNDRPKGTMIVDIGGGTTDIAVITMGSIAVSRSSRIAGNAFDEAIAKQIRSERNFIIGDKTAERIKIRIGSALYRDVELGMTVHGKNYIDGMPVSFEVTSTEVFLALRQCLEEIINLIKEVIVSTTPELAGDLLETGIVLTGGGSKLRNLDKMIERKTGIKTRVAAEPENCVALGTGDAFENMLILEKNGYVFRARSQIDGLEVNNQTEA